MGTAERRRARKSCEPATVVGSRAGGEEVEVLIRPRVGRWQRRSIRLSEGRRASSSVGFGSVKVPLIAGPTGPNSCYVGHSCCYREVNADLNKYEGRK